MKKHYFSKQWLDFQGIKLYSNGERILKCKERIYDITSLKTEIKVGQDFLEDTGDHQVISIRKLKELGITILVKNIKEGAWKKKQRRLYYPAKIRKDLVNEANETFVSRNMKIMHDPFNRRIRVFGDSVGSSNGQVGLGDDSGWFYYDET